MNKMARNALDFFLKTQNIPTIEDIGEQFNKLLETKHISFVTMYLDGRVVASSGRINIKRPNTILELIENTLFCLKDPRFVESVKNPDELKKVKFRVDIVRNEQRKIVNSLQEVDISKHGLILISQTLGKVGVILPHMSNLSSSPADLFELVCAKAGLDSKTLKDEDYLLYSIESDRFEDF